jgi:hypothetical protein
VTKSDDLYRRLALIGAQARLKEMFDELDEIYALFPELRPGGKSRVPSVVGDAPRRFSPKGKAAISEGMRKYWARRKAEAAKAAKVDQSTTKH